MIELPCLIGHLFVGCYWSSIPLKVRLHPLISQSSLQLFNTQDYFNMILNDSYVHGCMLLNGVLSWGAIAALCESVHSAILIGVSLASQWTTDRRWNHRAHNPLGGAAMSVWHFFYGMDMTKGITWQLSRVVMRWTCVFDVAKRIWHCCPVLFGF